MFIQRRSSFRRNTNLRDLTPAVPERKQRAPDNARWLASAGFDSGVILFGGNSVPHFRARVAQARMRGDLLPSYWSLSSILLGTGELFSVPFDRFDPQSSVPELNGVQRLRLRDFADVEAFPNVAVLQFPVDEAKLSEAIRALQDDRVSTRLTEALWQWLGYLWGVGETPNPAVKGVGLPCSQFVAAAFGACGVELLPGLAAGGACPEVLWNSALWWQDTFAPDPGKAVDPAKAPLSQAVRGAYRLLQPAAAARGHRDRMKGGTIVPSPDQRTVIDRALGKRGSSRRR